MTRLASEYPRLGCEAVTKKRPGQAARELSAVVAIVRGQLLQHYTGPGSPGDVPDEAEEVGGLGEDGEVEEDEALLRGGLPLHAGSLRAADHRYNK